MSVDEWALRDVARDLAALYRELDASKYDAAQPRGERVMRPRPGPKAPGNWLAISRDAELVSHLVEMVCDARNHVQPAYTVGRDGRVLCNWIAFNAAAVADLDFANDLHDLMQDQARKIDRWLHPADIGTVANKPEPHVDIEAIVRNLTQRGHRVTPRQARDVATYQGFDVIKYTDGRNGYLLTQFLDHYEKERA